MTSGLVVADGLGPEGALCRNPEPIPRQSRASGRRCEPARRLSLGALIAEKSWADGRARAAGLRRCLFRRSRPPHSRPTPPFTTRPRPCGGARMIGAKKNLADGRSPRKAFFLPLESGRRAPVGAPIAPCGSAAALRPPCPSGGEPRPKAQFRASRSGRKAPGARRFRPESRPSGPKPDGAQAQPAAVRAGSGPCPAPNAWAVIPAPRPPKRGRGGSEREPRADA